MRHCVLQAAKQQARVLRIRINKPCALAQLRPDSMLEHRCVRWDKLGWNRWAIVKLDWDYPPYLERLPERTGGQRVAVKVRSRMLALWRTYITFIGSRTENPKGIAWCGVIRYLHWASEHSWASILERTR